MMRCWTRVLTILACFFVGATAAQAQFSRRPVMRPARRVATVPAGPTEVSFRLSQAQPKFTYKFVAPDSNAYTAAATWTSKAAIQVSVAAPGLSRPAVEAGVPPVGVGFQGTKGQTYTVTVGPKQGVVQTSGQLAILAGGARKVFKPTATETGRLQAALARSEAKDAFLPIIAQLAERHLGNVRDKNELDRIFEEGLAKYPGVNRQLLTSFVRDMKAVPSNVKAKAFTATAVRMRPLAPVTATHVADALKSTGVAAIRAPAQAKVAAAATLRPDLRPRIDGLEPSAGTQGYSPGQQLTIVGRAFSTDANQNSVQILSLSALVPSFRLQPQSATSTRLTFRLPTNIAPGWWQLKVVVSRPMETTSDAQPAATATPARRTRSAAVRRTSPVRSLGLSASLRADVLRQLRPGAIMESHATNLVPLRIKEPPTPTPEITSISPPRQEPSQWVVISGRNFQPGKDHYVRMELLDLAEPRLWVEKAQATSSSTQLRVQLPASLIAGNYMFQVAISRTPVSDAIAYTVGTPRYRIVFERIKCVDESNPEWWGSDEIVTFWTVTADGDVWTKNTDEYGGFDDGDLKNYKAADRNIFRIDGSWGEIQYGMLLVTQLYEWDVGDVHAMQDFVGFMGHVAAGLASLSGGLPLAAVIEAVAWLMKQVIGAIASWFGGDPDHLGTEELYLSYHDLQRLVPPGGSYARSLHFYNSGSTGSYRLYYRITRAS